MTNTNAAVNMDALLEGSLDDLADLPEFKPYPIGVHRAQIFLEPKKVNDKLAISVNFKYVSVVELADPLDKVPEVGAVANVLCQMDNEFGQGLFKKIRTVLQPVCGLRTARRIGAGTHDDARRTYDQQDEFLPRVASPARLPE